MPANVLPADQIANRLRAARALANLSVEELAARLGPGLSGKTIGNMEREQRPARMQDLRAIAHACSLPYEFFTVDFNEALGNGDIEKTVRALAARLEEQQDEIDELRLSLVGDAIDDATRADAADDHNVRVLPDTGRRAQRKEDGRG